jgi:hypothetical protein
MSSIEKNKQALTSKLISWNIETSITASVFQNLAVMSLSGLDQWPVLKRTNKL